METDGQDARTDDPREPWWGPAGRADLVGGGLRAYSRIAWHWDLNDEEAAALLGASPSTYVGWSRALMVGLPISLNEPTRDALLTRLCALSEIADALKRAHDGDVAAAAAWMRRPNAASAFMGRAPLEALLADGARGIGRVLTHALDLAEAAPPDSARRNID